MSDSHQTHINVFIQEYEEAHKAAVAAVDTLREKADAVISRLKQVETAGGSLEASNSQAPEPKVKVGNSKSKTAA